MIVSVRFDPLESTAFAPLATIAQAKVDAVMGQSRLGSEEGTLFVGYSIPAAPLQSRASGSSTPALQSSLLKFVELLQVAGPGTSSKSTPCS